MAWGYVVVGECAYQQTKVQIQSIKQRIEKKDVLTEVEKRRFHVPEKPRSCGGGRECAVWEFVVEVQNFAHRNGQTPCSDTGNSNVGYLGAHPPEMNSEPHHTEDMCTIYGLG